MQLLNVKHRIKIVSFKKFSKVGDVRFIQCKLLKVGWIITCFIHCMLLNHCVMTVFSLKKRMKE